MDTDRASHEISNPPMVGAATILLVLSATVLLLGNITMTWQAAVGVFGGGMAVGIYTAGYHLQGGKSNG